MSRKEKQYKGRYTHAEFGKDHIPALRKRFSAVCKLVGTGMPAGKAHEQVAKQHGVKASTIKKDCYWVRMWDRNEGAQPTALSTPRPKRPPKPKAPARPRCPTAPQGYTVAVRVITRRDNLLAMGYTAGHGARPEEHTLVGSMEDFDQSCRLFREWAEAEQHRHFGPPDGEVATVGVRTETLDLGWAVKLDATIVDGEREAEVMAPEWEDSIATYCKLDHVEHLGKAVHAWAASIRKRRGV